LGESKTPYTFKSGDVLSFDGTAVEIADGNRYNCTELRGAIKQGWLQLADSAEAIPVPTKTPFVRPIKPANMAMHGTERFVPEIEISDGRVVGDAAMSPMINILRDFEAELRGAPDAHGISARTEVRPQYPVHVQDESDTHGRIVSRLSSDEDSPTIRGMRFNRTNNVVRDLSGLTPTTPEGPVVRHNAPIKTASKFSVQEENGQVHAFVSSSNRSASMEESSKARVSGVADVSNPTASVGAAIQRDAAQRTPDGDGFKIRGLLRTSTQMSAVVGDSTNAVQAEENRLAREIASSRRASILTSDSKPQSVAAAAPEVDVEKIRYEVVRIFVPDFKWDLSREDEEKIGEIQEIITKDLKSPTLKAIFAVESEGIRREITSRLKAKMKKSPV